MPTEDNYTTIDPKETAFFTKVSGTWWNDEAIDVLRDMSKIMGAYIIGELVKTYLTSECLKNLKVLEVGCGGGYLTENLAQFGLNIVAIDVNADLIRIAKDHASRDASVSHIEYLLESIEDHGLSNPKKYDVVISNFVLEHVNNHELFIKSCAACVKEGGSLFMSSFSNTYLNWFGSIIAPEYIMKTIPYGAHDLNKCINAKDTERIMKSCNFNINNTQGIFYNCFTGNLYWVPTNQFFVRSPCD